jgi:hypothetical protein
MPVWSTSHQMFQDLYAAYSKAFPRDNPIQQLRAVNEGALSDESEVCFLDLLFLVLYL